MPAHRSSLRSNLAVDDGTEIHYELRGPNEGTARWWRSSTAS